jgi:hypothetical protein
LRRNRAAARAPFLSAGRARRRRVVAFVIAAASERYFTYRRAMVLTVFYS